MKKITLFLLAAAALFAACTKVEPVHKSFTATFDSENSNGTRTELVTGNEVHWIAGDAITIFDGETNVQSTTTDAGASAKFEADLSSAAPYYALYPYDANAVINGSKKITTTLLAVQRAKAGSFADDLNICVAKTEASTFSFKNVLSYLKFRVPETDVKRVTIKGADNEDLAGRIQIAINGEGVPSVYDVKSGARVVTLLPPSGESTFATETDYFIAVIPGSLSNGFWMLFTKTDNSISVARTGNSATFNRSGILNMGAPTLVQSTDVINFKDGALLAQYGDSFTVGEAAATTTIPDAIKTSVSYFDEFVFFGCTGGLSGFQNNTSLTQIILPAGITSCNSNCFDGCNSLESIIINDNCTGFAGRSFQTTTSLNSIIIPSVLTNISGNTFTSAGNKDVYYLQSTPPSSIAGTAFKHIYNFYIPSGSQSAYSTAFSAQTGTINYIEY